MDKVEAVQFYKLIKETEPDWDDNLRLLKAQGYSTRTEYGPDGYNQEDTGRDYLIFPDKHEVRYWKNNIPVITTKRVETGDKEYVPVSREEIVQLFTSSQPVSDEGMKEAIAEVIYHEYLEKNIHFNDTERRHHALHEASQILPLVHAYYSALIEQAKKEGRKEVVEWVKKRYLIPNPVSEADKGEWQNQLKEWGINGS